MSQKVQVVKVNADGIRAVIYGKDLAWNKSKNEFFVRTNGKWIKTAATPLQQEILKDRHASKMWKQERIAYTEPRRYSSARFDRQAFLDEEQNVGLEFED